MKPILTQALILLAATAVPAFSQVTQIESSYEVLADPGSYSIGTNGFADATPANSPSNTVRLIDIGDSIQFPFSVPSTGFYDLYVRARSGSQGNDSSYAAGYRFEIDGIARPYTLSGSPRGWDSSLGNLAWGYFKLTNVQLSAGLHSFIVRSAFTHCYVDAFVLSMPGSVGPTPVPSPTPIPATPTPTPSPTPTPLPPQASLFEAESHFVVINEKGTSPVAVTSWGTASPLGSAANNAVQLIDVGDTIAITFNVPTARVYTLRARVRRGSNGTANSYASAYLFQIDNAARTYSTDPAATQWDSAYAGVGWGYLTLNPVALQAGQHTLTVSSIYSHSYVDVVSVEWNGAGPTPTPTPTPVPFPNGVTGIRLWLRADDATAGPGGAVSIWNDSSLRAHHATAVTPGQEPVKLASILNGHAVIRFPGSNESAYQLPNIFAASPAVTRGELYVVARMNFSNANGSSRENGIWKFSNTVGASTRSNGAYFKETFGRSVAGEFAVNPTTLSSFSLYDARAISVGIGGGAITTWLNGLQRYNDAGGTAEWSYIPTLGRGATSFRGDIAEVIAIGPEPDPDVREAISKYLVQKYALLDYPIVPGDFALIQNPSGNITFRWTPNSRDERTAYIVERNTGSGFVEISRVYNFSESPTDSPPSGTTRYRLRAENLRGISAPSYEVSITRP